jgi:hypothetical protein
MSETRQSWGDYGVYEFEEFLKGFSQSPELMRTPLEGYFDCIGAIQDMIVGRQSNLYSAGPGLGFALYEYANRMVPHRVEDASGRANVFNPHREKRVGAHPSIPKQGPDVFRAILDGDESGGQALIAGFDQETDMPVDDLLTRQVGVRRVSPRDAHAIAILNKFPAYVRLIDEKLYTLLECIGFVSRGQFREGKLATLRTIPRGLNFVIFPLQYTESLSSIAVFDLYAVLRATQRALLRVRASGQMPSLPYDVFFNIKELAGGTLPRIHMQAYVRTHIEPGERYDLNAEGQVSMKSFGETEVAKLNGDNRSWSAYVPPVRSGKFDIRFELKRETWKEFVDLTEIELWDVAEMLAYHSHVLDIAVGVPERNIQFFPTGVVVRPFAVDGGHEKIRLERIYGQPSRVFAEQYNRTEVPLFRDVLFRPPGDPRGHEVFRRLVDSESRIFRCAA